MVSGDLRQEKCWAEDRPMRRHCIAQTMRPVLPGLLRLRSSSKKAGPAKAPANRATPKVRATKPAALSAPWVGASSGKQSAVFKSFKEDIRAVLLHAYRSLLVTAVARRAHRQRDNTMDKLTKTLLGGVALSLLATAPATAQQKHPGFSVSALYAGRAVKKTKLHNQVWCRGSSCTISFTTNVHESDLHKTGPLTHTFYKVNSNETICSNPRQRLKAPKKSEYGKVHAATETYSLGCSNDPIVFYGDTYKLTDSSAKGKVDSFTSILKGEYMNNGMKYKGSLNMDVYVFIK